MQIIGASDAKSRFGELLDRTSRGETFLITKDGIPVGKLVPPEDAQDSAAIAEAVNRLKRFRSTFKGMTRSDFTTLKHRGHRF